ncbi:hypothetical protein Ssi03_58120 [Sphaerisporangium siamense]|uniref:Tetracycline repressor TetR C-terminal domain-containing protein n=1 Tax=Sphaerisporangium siamense TaxID=795645 RepID=A0A7W7G8K5_9ACTN|nr:TetR/AcrR family transcriptional regulator C-terminal domain-containing protein [Sphaerisporangium siamense]MBB4700402.1 hypothetical protein [Sphaerisporangium siamense]GII87822.1 hypothetical protein Ssi03_58120 [Sphaerisporangium siamense]
MLSVKSASRQGHTHPQPLDHRFSRTGVDIGVPPAAGTPRSAGEAERLLSRHAWGDEDARARWQAAHAAYVGDLLATGRYPYLGRVVVEAEHPPIESSFAFGLDILLDGIAARLAR